MVKQFHCLIDFGLYLKITPWFPKLHGVMEGDLGFFGTGLPADPVWKVNNTKGSFVRDKQNLCNGLERDSSGVWKVPGRYAVMLIGFGLDSFLCFVTLGTIVAMQL